MFVKTTKNYNAFFRIKGRFKLICFIPEVNIWFVG